MNISSQRTPNPIVVAGGSVSPPLISIALVSAAALAYEILLMRLFAIIQWHHFAYMVISLALLGFGASGTFIAIFRPVLLRWFGAFYVASLVLFGLSSLACFLIVQEIQLNPEEMLWDPRQFTRLVANYLLLTVPFFFGATAVGLALTRFHTFTARLYAADLLGAGLGSVLVILILFVVFPGDALRLIAAAGLAAAAIAWIELRMRPGAGMAAVALLTICPLLLPSNWLELQLSPYKDLSQTLRVAGTQIIEQRSSPLGLISVVQSEQVPLRYAPGLSLAAPSGPGDQLALFTDGNGPSVITGLRDESVDLGYLASVTSALPFFVMQPKSVLVLGAGGGTDVLRALQLGAERVNAVELNPQIVNLVREDYAEYAGDIYRRAGVKVHIAEARGFVASHAARYDLIELPLQEAFGSASGLYALHENYLYTVEAMQELLHSLTPNGFLAMTRWVKVPPRDALKLFATAVAALERSGVNNPADHLVLIRGWQTSTLLVKNSAVSEQEIDTVREFCEGLSFDLAYFPGIQRSEANRYNILAEPYFYNGAQALLGKASEDYLQRYKFDIRPATDNRPYFSHFFKWSTLPEILRLRSSGGLPLLESAYLILVVTLLQALVFSLVLILLPLIFHRREASATRAVIRWRVVSYFLTVGLAFLFLEIAFIQKFTQFLHHPLYAAAVVLAGFLVFAGLGSLLSQRIVERIGELKTVGLAVLIIALLGSIYLVGLGPVFNALAAMNVWLKVLFSTAVIAPLAFVMGIPFPTALTRLGRSSPYMVPWAWGVNGCASVLSAVLATLLAIHFGFATVIVLALILYGVAALSFSGWEPRAKI